MDDNSIIADSIIANMFCEYWDKVPRSVLKHLSKVVNYSLVPERLLIYQKEVRDIVKWHRVDRMYLVRLLVRCIDHDIDIVNKLNLKSRDYKIKEISYLLKRRPEFIRFFDIDLNKITTTEAASVLSLGSDYYLDKVKFSKYKFNFKESMSIIRGYNYRKNIVEQVNYKSLKGYQIVEILINTNTESLDLFDLSKITTTDWLTLIESNPDMISICDLNKFENSDIFNSIKLCCIFNDTELNYLILKRDLKLISPFGWEKLLIHKNEFNDLCDFNKLDENNWRNISEYKPELIKYKI